MAESTQEAAQPGCQLSSGHLTKPLFAFYVAPMSSLAYISQHPEFSHFWFYVGGPPRIHKNTVSSWGMGEWNGRAHLVAGAFQGLLCLA